MPDSLWAPSLPPRRREQWVLDYEVQTRLDELAQTQLDDLYCRIYQFGQYSRTERMKWFGNHFPVPNQFG